MVYMYSISYFKENDDDCVTAGEIYSCGKEKEPAIVNAIFNAEKGNTTVVCNINTVFDFSYKFIG
jgi:hypothetical protein